ncbi:MAG: SDR family NAD(P)-dependent oxidoreductase [Kiritimatiellae bacterium]|nr:SDR family NAD(P)-dependent oxidoreductase [Kiritimatiellia bacterium]
MSYCTLVTGATGGIGTQTIKLLKSKGRHVLALGHELDLTDPKALDEVEGLVKAEYEGVDGFVHLAGFDRPAPLGMIDDLTADDLYRIHALFPMRFLGWMGKKRNHGPGAAAVLVSSEVLSGEAKGHAAYAAAKGALEAMARVAAAELEAQGVRVAMLRLPPVDTKMAHGWVDKLAPDQRPALLPATEAAKRIVDEFENGAIVWTIDK